jgi:two-component system, chemotaxis family, response regulator Rcp1
MKRGTPQNPFHLLLVEDNPGDVDLMVEGLSETPVAHTLAVAADGVEALAYLRREGPHAQAPPPDLVLLDLNVPKMDGREVLAEIRRDEALQHLVVVVLTSSEAERDLLQAYRTLANCYVSKPVDLQEFLSLVQALARFWFTVARLPPRVG